MGVIQDTINILERTIKQQRTTIERYLEDRFEATAVQGIITTIMDEYDSQLAAAVTNRDSRTRPEQYREDFLERLEEFDYISSIGTKITLSVPDMDNFDFSGRLKIIQTILDGTAGTYVEVDEEQYVQMYNRQPRRTDVFDPDVPKKERIYLLRWNIDVRNRLSSNNIKIVRFPFSNTPPFDIFTAAENYVTDNMNEWISEFTAEFTKLIKRKL